MSGPEGEEPQVEVEAEVGVLKQEPERVEAPGLRQWQQGPQMRMVEPMQSEPPEPELSVVYRRWRRVRREPGAGVCGRRELADCR